MTAKQRRDAKANHRKRGEEEGARGAPSSSARSKPQVSQTVPVQVNPVVTWTPPPLTSFNTNSKVITFSRCRNN